MCLHPWREEGTRALGPGGHSTSPASVHHPDMGASGTLLRKSCSPGPGGVRGPSDPHKGEYSRGREQQGGGQPEDGELIKELNTLGSSGASGLGRRACSTAAVGYNLWEAFSQPCSASPCQHLTQLSCQKENEVTLSRWCSQKSLLSEQWTVPECSSRACLCLVMSQ